MNKAMLLKQYMSYMPKKSRLPSGYQEVEYIENTGTQYFDSGVKGTELAYVYADWYFGSSSHILGNENSSMPNGRIGFAISSASVTMQAGGYATVDDENVEKFIRYKVKLSFVHGDVWYQIDNNEKVYPPISSWSTSDTLSERTSLHMYVFRKASAIATAGHKCYRLTFTNYDNVVIRDFIPCYRKSDNEIGLYDIVNNQFYTNQGSGTFLKGADV